MWNLHKVSIHNSAMKMDNNPLSITNQPKETAEIDNSIDTRILWIHCNKCLKLYVFKNKLVFLSCKHILCEDCLKLFAVNGKRTCPFCKKTVSCLLIDNNMPPQYKRFFNPTPWENLNNFKDVIPFQNQQRDHFVKCSFEKCELAGKQIQFNNKVKAETVAVKKKIKTIDLLLKKVENENKKLLAEHKKRGLNVNLRNSEQGRQYYPVNETIKSADTYSKFTPQHYSTVVENFFK